MKCSHTSPCHWSSLHFYEKWWWEYLCKMMMRVPMQNDWGPLVIRKSMRAIIKVSLFVSSSIILLHIIHNYKTLKFSIFKIQTIVFLLLILALIIYDICLNICTHDTSGLYNFLVTRGYEYLTIRIGQPWIINMPRAMMDSWWSWISTSLKYHQSQAFLELSTFLSPQSKLWHPLLDFCFNILQPEPLRPSLH